MIEDQNFPIKEDDFIIINSNTSHTERSVGEIPLEYIILGVEGLNFSFGGEHEHLIFNCRRDHEEFAYFMDSLLEEMENKKPHYELVCQDLLNMLIVKLIRRTNFSFEFVPSVKSSRECIKLKQYMEANYNQNITLDTLAQVSHLNKYYMVHAFTRQFGCSPHELSDGGKNKGQQGAAGQYGLQYNGGCAVLRIFLTELFCPVLSETLPYDGQRLPEGPVRADRLRQVQNFSPYCPSKQETALRSVTLSPSLTCPTSISLFLSICRRLASRAFGEWLA